MIVAMQETASEEQIQQVIEHLVRMGFSVHRTTGERQSVLAAVGARIDFDTRNLEVLSGVEHVHRISAPYKLAGRSFRPEGTIIEFPNGLKVGGNGVVVIAGPCSVESREQLFTISELIAKAGARALRGGAFKPRSSPYSFQGMGLEGLKLLREAGDRFKLLVISEVMEISQISLMLPYVDIFQVGARNMQNFNLLNAVGQQSKPVLLKRGMSATLEEFLLAAEYIMSKGNTQVMLCERGIRTYEEYVRNTLALAAVPELQRVSHLPVVVDPSQGTGKSHLIDSMCRAAVAAGADGLIIEVHNDPEHALTDGAQSITPKQFKEMMASIKRIATAIDREV